MDDIFLILIGVSLFVNILLIISYIRLKKAINVLDLNKYKNCVIAMLEAQEQFEKISDLRVKQIKKLIHELEEVGEAVDEKILYYESLKEGN
ncbi:MAG: hypothetical protein WC337_03815 [Candidatus Muiribacteriota bacterium]